MKSLLLNCTLKPSPETSNTAAMITMAEKMFHKLGVETEVVRVVDFNVKPGVSSDQGEGDAWPQILEKIRACDVFVLATPVWRGDRSSIAKRVAERMDGIWSETDSGTGQYVTYNKVAGVMVDGNEDGAKKAVASICMDLTEHGFTLPASNFTYYVGKAGPGPSYIEAGGERHLFTNKSMLFMVHNLVHLARVLQAQPYPTNLNELVETARKMSDPPPG